MGENPRKAATCSRREAVFHHEMEAVVGAEIARLDRLHLGSQFHGSHGWGRGGDIHTNFTYTVVGVLAPSGTSIDRAVFTDYRSVGPSMLTRMRMKLRKRKKPVSANGRRIWSPPCSSS